MKERLKTKRPDIIHASGPLTVREVISTQGGYSWTTYLVQGWKEDGKWQRKKFKALEEAKGFVALKAVELINTDTSLNTVVTSLTHDQMKEAEGAFLRLGGKYALGEVVEFYLKNHFDPKCPTRLKDVIDDFLAAKTVEGLEPRSVGALKQTINQFNRHMEALKAPDLVLVHEIASEDIVGFLSALRSKDGKDIAKRKTYNNKRADLGSFFTWASSPLKRLVDKSPVDAVHFFDKKKVEAQRNPIDVMTPEKTAKLFEYLKTFKRGAYVKYYALACFAGLRPNSEIERLAVHPQVDHLIDLKQMEIELPASICPKSSGKRTVSIQPNLAAWLKAYPGPILRGKNLRGDLATIIKDNGLSQDVCRHSWFTYFIGITNSIGQAALEGGNSERVVRDHYDAVVKKRKAQAAKYWSVMP